MPRGLDSLGIAWIPSSEMSFFNALRAPKGKTLFARPHLRSMRPGRIQPNPPTCWGVPSVRPFAPFLRTNIEHRLELGKHIFGEASGADQVPKAKQKQERRVPGVKRRAKTKRGPGGMWLTRASCFNPDEGARNPSPAWGRCRAKPDGWGAASCFDASRLHERHRQTCWSHPCFPHPIRRPRRHLPRFAEKGARRRRRLSFHKHPGLSDWHAWPFNLLWPWSARIWADSGWHLW